MDSAEPSWEPIPVSKPWERSGSEGSSIHPPRFPPLPGLPVSSAMVNEMVNRGSSSEAKELPENHTHYSTRVPYASPHPCEIQNNDASLSPLESIESAVCFAPLALEAVDHSLSGPSSARSDRISDLDDKYRSLTLLNDPALAEKLQIGRFGTSRDFDPSLLFKQPSSESAVNSRQSGPPSSSGASSNRRLLRLLAEEQTTVDKASQVALMGLRAVEDSIDGSSEATTPAAPRQFRSIALLRRDQLLPRSAYEADEGLQAAEEGRESGSGFERRREAVFLLIMHFSFLILAAGVALAAASEQKLSSIDVPLDHFSLVANQSTFPTRYWLSTEHYDPHGAGCVVYFIMGGESPLPETGIIYPFVSQRLSAKHNGIVIESEHRFYGTSVPSPYEESLPYLSIEQSLMDHVVVLQTALREVRGAEQCRVVAVGGSYSGFLALAFRLRYPKLVHAAYASSSPGRFYSQEAEFDGHYYKIITDAADKIFPGCSRETSRAFEDFQHRYGGRMTFDQAREELRICNPEALGPESGLYEELVQWVRIMFSSANMASYPPTNTSATYQLCYTVVQSGIAGIFKALAKGPDCLDVTRYLPSANKQGVHSASCGDWTGCGVGQAGRSWDWQTCTELVEHISTYGPSSDMFPPRKFAVDGWLNAHCKESFGDEVFRNFSDTSREHRLNDLWGFDEASLAQTTSRVLFVNGGMDGWTAGAVTRNLSDSILSLTIPSGAHHSEMAAPSANDTEDMVAARDRIEEILGSWLGLRGSSFGDAEEIAYKSSAHREVYRLQNCQSMRFTLWPVASIIPASTLGGHIPSIIDLLQTIETTPNAPPMSYKLITVRPSADEIRCEDPPRGKHKESLQYTLRHDPTQCLIDELGYGYYEYRLKADAVPFEYTFRDEDRRRGDIVKRRSKISTTQDFPTRRQLYRHLDSGWRRQIVHRSPDVLIMHPLAVFGCDLLTELFSGGGIRPKIVIVGAGSGESLEDNFNTESLHYEDLGRWKALQCRYDQYKLPGNYRPIGHHGRHLMVFGRTDVFAPSRFPMVLPIANRGRSDCATRRVNARGWGHDDAVITVPFHDTAEECRTHCSTYEDSTGIPGSCKFWTFDGTGIYGAFLCWMWIDRYPQRVTLQAGWESGECWSSGDVFPSRL
ncbi:hypothetical protein FOL47_002627 [Perkinsus chesapeaki]|uniref:Thymus-specific serine protease n=1 Tax=Perkinsus chesapeaki TaxID=330153 RepID=A0A7J6MCC5_PERCH|nr:hypothetical protein FOL47_002627 [Perkinsus chesapeaki]